MEENNVVIWVMVFWVVAAIAVYALADWKGRSGLLFFFLALLLSPVIMLLVVASIPPTQEALDKRGLRRGDLKKCDNCGALSTYLSYKCDSCGQQFKKAQEAS